MCVRHPLHPSFFVSKLWSYFIGAPPTDAERQALEMLYVANGYQVRPVVEAILLHPQLYSGPRMVKPPIVMLAGMMRALRYPVRGDGWAWLCENAGQVLFNPPDVSGWDDTRWLDTSTLRGRWELIGQLLNGRQLTNTQVNNYDATETAEQALTLALSTWGNPNLTLETAGVLLGFGNAAVSGSLASWQQRTYRGLRQNALRHLIAFSPDYQTT
jgi:uncharacterized protein (DUF1800 family)